MTVMQLQNITLRNGSSEPKMIVVATMRSLKSLMETDIAAFCELVRKCRNQSHKIDSDVVPTLEAKRLISNDAVNESIKNVVLSAVEGENMDMVLVDPIR
jgi:hypothetical protein